MDDHNSYTLLCTEKKRRWHKRCYYYDCKNNDSNPNLRFIPFPKPTTPIATERAKKWLILTRRSDFQLSDINKNTYVCHTHFVDPRGPTELNPDPIPATGSMALCDHKPPKRLNYSQIQVKNDRIRLASQAKETTQPKVADICISPTDPTECEKIVIDVEPSSVVIEPSLVKKLKEKPTNDTDKLIKTNMVTKETQTEEKITDEKILERVRHICPQWYSRVIKQHNKTLLQFLLLTGKIDIIPITVDAIRNKKEFILSACVGNYKIRDNHQIWAAFCMPKDLTCLFHLLDEVNCWSVCMGFRNGLESRKINCDLLCQRPSVLCTRCVQNLRPKSTIMPSTNSRSKVNNRYLTHEELRKKLKITTNKLRVLKNKVARREARLKKMIDEDDRLINENNAPWMDEG